MPRDSNGVFSLPQGYLATTGQTILASQHNPPLEDIAGALTGSIPRNGTAPMQANLPMAGFKVTGAGPATAPGDLVNKSQIDLLTPVGSILDYAGANAPTGWLLCYGQAVSRVDYAALFTAIGTTFGVGNGTTTFNVPDCRGRVIAGKDNMGGTALNKLNNTLIDGKILGAVGGVDTHVLLIAEMPAHNHGGNTGPGTPHSHAYSRLAPADQGDGVREGSNRGPYDTAQTVPESAHTHPISSQGGGTAHNNVQPTIVLNKIIRF